LSVFARVIVQTTVASARTIADADNRERKSSAPADLS
jgi:hypothetical protein